MAIINNIELIRFVFFRNVSVKIAMCKIINLYQKYTWILDYNEKKPISY